MQPALSTKASAVERTVSWLTLPREIVGHLFFAAAEIGQVQVDLFSESVGAVLAFPHHGSRTIDLVFPAPIMAHPAPGTVRVRYHFEGSSYEFITGLVCALDDRRWRLALPNAVSRAAGRGDDRFQVRRDGRFQVVLERDDGAPMFQQAHDLSMSGISFSFRPARLTLEEGDQLLATLSLPREQRIPVLLEVRHTRPERSGLPVSIAGCALLGISPWGRSLLRQAIAGLGS